MVMFDSRGIHFSTVDLGEWSGVACIPGALHSRPLSPMKSASLRANFEIAFPFDSCVKSDATDAIIIS